MSRLLILACSQRKKPGQRKLPAIERYDGPAFRVVRKYLRESDGDPIRILILSAKYGLIAANEKIGNYDCRLNQTAALRMSGAEKPQPS